MGRLPILRRENLFEFEVQLHRQQVELVDRVFRCEAVALDLPDERGRPVDEVGNVALGVPALLANLLHTVDYVFVEIGLHTKKILGTITKQQKLAIFALTNSEHSVNNRKDMYVIDERFPDEKTGVRYVLGEVFDPKKTKALICVGVNPSTATPEKLDRTLMRVRRLAEKSGEYGAWYMLNVYPQRATDPQNMHKIVDETIHRRNIQEIGKLLDTIPAADVWCAWGTLVKKRPYLCDMRDEILKLFADRKGFELKSHVLTKVGHPAHPLARIQNPDKTSGFLKEYKPEK